MKKNITNTAVELLYEQKETNNKIPEMLNVSDFQIYLGVFLKRQINGENFSFWFLDNAIRFRFLRMWYIATMVYLTINFW